MVCNLCKQNEATVHLTQIVENDVKKVDLCEACAKEKGVNDPAGFSLADLLLGLGASQEIEQATSASGELRCPNCGYTQADFKKTGRLGCSECYQTFAEGLGSVLKSMHKGTRHRGKVPTQLRRAHDAVETLTRLEKELQSAISKEDFEQAAVLRDEIKVAKGSGPNP
jgi:protein arginine kinase activator